MGEMTGMPEPADAITDELLEIADALLPGHSLDGARVTAGNLHHVVLVPGTAAVRVSKRPSSAEEMPRRMEVLREVAEAGLPFAVPEPLTPVTRFGERAAVAVSWIDGKAQPEGQGDPEQIGRLLRAVREVAVTPRLGRLLNAPRDQGWGEVLADEVVPRLPDRWRSEVHRRLEAAMALKAVPDALVHGDLGGANVHWSRDGELVGVLDWDQAHLFDPAVDAALMAWHGWDTVKKAVDPDTYRRARIYDAVFGVGHLVGVLDGRPLVNVEGYVRSIVDWLEKNAWPTGSEVAGEAAAFSS
ncbi:Phosphotransferase enzyme family protein [Nonomuraea coxensis DSM 45129]|uniref:Phosphotransferase enzyme family protein n=1 Tax=Nonomuraea coxensis DSM 45129 TaxID=1122611 RepID=A0ABX8TRD6_9ACTN|nr:phosphotransferase [Nonomuraea coxensis]QYC37938.1 Phosphotransferase enzyme family protein [Nonomuraea coxensis DSM 45129]